MTCSLQILSRCMFDMYIDMYIAHVYYFFISCCGCCCLIYKMYYEYAND
jgi:hypothetical protein